MKELHAEGLATHGDPESWAYVPRGRGPSVDRGTRKLAMEPRNQPVGGADAVQPSGRQHARGRHASPQATSARSKTPCERGTFMCENREIHGLLVCSDTSRKGAAHAVR